MLKKFYPIFFLLISSIAFACGGNCNCGGGDKLSLKIEIAKLDAWFNVMPGGPPSLHFTGDLKIKNTSDELINSLILREVKIIQNKEEIYSFNDVIFKALDEGNLELKPGEEDSFVFISQQNIPIKESFERNNQASFHLFFTDNGKEFEYVIDNITFENIY